VAQIVVQSSPVLSVILPVYNGLPYLRQAIESVLTQSFGDFELIVINDGSSDGSQQLLETFDDPRMRIVQQGNRGLAATLNIGIAQARGRYLARQDQDDICLPGRFEKQVNFLDANADVMLLGTAAEIWEGHSRTERVMRHAIDGYALRFGLLFNNYFIHSSVMLRRSVFERVGGYSEDKARQPPEDYELWSRIAREFDVANLPEVLMAYREVPGSMSRTGSRPFVKNLVQICAENVAFACGVPVDSPEVLGLANLLHGRYDAVPKGVQLSQMEKLIEAAALGVGLKVGGVSPALALARQQKLREARYLFADHHTGGLLGLAVRSPVGVAARKLLRWAA
jgi:glycosyltransferase involved in cell wall biosynthesis